MKKVLFIAFTMLISTQIFAGTKLTCTPADNNGYFTDNITVQKVDADTIKVNNVELNLDSTYAPRISNSSFKRYTGETESASNWSDSGSVEIFFNGRNALKITVRGEMFINESFTCK